MGIALSAGVLVFALVPFAPASVVHVGRPADGRGCHLEVSAEIDAPVDDVRAVVADFAGYGEWFPSVHSVAAKAPGEYELQFRLPWPLKHVREHLAVVEE